MDIKNLTRIAFVLTILFTPFIVCDPYPATTTQPSHFSIQIDSSSAVDSPAETLPDGSVRMKHDIGNVSPGQHNVKIKAVLIDSVWGRLESAEVPFVFTRPSAAAPPAGIILIK